MPEEGEEAPVPEPPHDGVFYRAGELVVAAIHDDWRRSAESPNPTWIVVSI